MRIILYTGKGGVGKTTVSAATALRTSQMGHRTLVISTDPAHSLADAFDLPLGHNPTPVTERLWGQEVNVLQEISTYWGEVQTYLAALFATRGIDDVVAEEIAVLPGMDELCSLLHVKRHAQSGEYDCLVVDCAPTGETMRLLSFPEVAEWYMEKLFPWERRIAKTLRPLVQPLVPIPLPTDSVYDAVERLFNHVRRIKPILSDPTLTSVRLVLNPEKMVIKEAQRAFTYLNLYGYPTDAVISNRNLPDSLTDPYFRQWHASQRRYREAIGHAFAPLPILEAPFFDHEIVGLKALGEMAEALFPTQDPSKILYAGSLQAVEKKGEEYVLRLRLPFVSREQVQMVKHGDELAVSIGNFRRDLILPRALSGLEVRKAQLEEGELILRFGAAARPTREPLPGPKPKSKGKTR